MTKKHFIELADMIRATMPKDNRLDDAQWKRDRDALADFCQSQNPRFDRQRWLNYIDGKCGPSGGKV